MTPHVSVVIPAYQNAAYIEATMDSVLAQSYTDFEVVVADHSSTDATPELLRRYTDDPRVRLLNTPTGGGAERNWNRVSDAATGRLIKLVCGDDLLYPDLLARQVEAMDGSGEGTVMAASSRDIVDASGAVILSAVGLGGLKGRVDGRAALRRSVRRGANIFGEPACTMLRRDVLVAAGGWHGRPDFMIDQATYCRALLRGDLVVVPGPLAAFRISGTQLSVQMAHEQSTSAAAMHRELAGLETGLLSNNDVRIGNAMATMRAVQRRLAYAYLERRRRLDPAVEAEI